MALETLKSINKVDPPERGGGFWFSLVLGESMKKVSTIVEQVRNVEGFNIKILDGEIQKPYCPNKKVDFSYDYKRAASSKMTVSQWSQQRMPDEVGVEVVNAEGKTVHGRTQLNTVRQSYAPVK